METLKEIWSTSALSQVVSFIKWLFEEDDRFRLVRIRNILQKTTNDMKNFTSILSFALMLTIVGLVLFHTWIWPCGIEQTPSASNTVHVTQTQEFDSTQWILNYKEFAPVEVVYRDKPFIPQAVAAILPSNQNQAPIVTSNTFILPLVLSKEDTAAIVDLFIRQVVFYSDTPDIPDSAQITLTINDSIGANSILHREVLVKNTRPVSETNVNSYYADRFMVFPGLQFGGITDFKNNQFKPMAGFDVAFKFKSNTNLRIGYMVGPDIQLYSVGVSQLLRFKKIGDLIRTNQLNRKIRKGIISL